MSCFPRKQIKTKQNVNLCFSNTVFGVCETEQVVYVRFSPVKICRSARATTSQNSHYCAPVHSVQTSSFSKHKGGTQFGLLVRQLVWEERLSRWSTTQSLCCAFAGAYVPARRTFLSLMCAVMGFMLIPCRTTKFHMLTIKGKNCVFTTQFVLHSYHY